VRALRAFVAAVCAVVVLAGCSSITGGRASVAATTTGLAPVTDIAFDPCAALDDAVIARLQLDPATKMTYNDGAPKGFETGCRWKNATLNSTIGLDVGRTTRSGQDYLNNTAFTQIAATTVGAHQAVEFTSSKAETTFSVAVEVHGGVVIMSANTSIAKVSTTAPDAKTEVVRMATIIEPLLPS
jgi:hypothetical protein